VWSASRPGHFTPGTYSIRGWVGPKSRSGRHGENSSPYQDPNSDPSVIQPIACRYTGSSLHQYDGIIKKKETTVPSSPKLCTSPYIKTFLPNRYFRTPAVDSGKACHDRNPRREPREYSSENYSLNQSTGAAAFCF
jgi:hypothetical protein